MIQRFIKFTLSKMRLIDKIVIHCSATPKGKHFDVHDLRLWHTRDRGWSDVGYHLIVLLDGTIQRGRPLELMGAGVFGFNRKAIHIVYIGGANGEDTRTLAQVVSLRVAVEELLEHFPKSEVLGHRDLSPDKNKNGKIDQNEWLKYCPSFDVKTML